MQRKDCFKFFVLTLSLMASSLSGAVEGNPVENKKTLPAKIQKFVLENHRVFFGIPALFGAYYVLTSQALRTNQIAHAYTHPWQMWTFPEVNLSINKLKKNIVRLVGLFGIASELVGSYILLTQAYKLAKMGIEKVKQQKVNHE